ncbi:Lysine--tRNA ligase [subsurface metagenome]
MGRKDQIVNERLRKIKELKEKGINPYPYKFDKKNKITECLKLKLGTKVKTAGRLMAKRNIGKITFANLEDDSGRIQIVIQEKETPQRIIQFFKKYIDVGDFIGVEGKIFKTKTKEISILVNKLELLSKAILPLPEKWYGLQDKEERYRKRYLDLIMNPKVKKVFETRRKIIESMRKFLVEKGFVEVETPILQPIYGGTNAAPFKSHLNALNMTVYMRISNEMYLKRLIVGGYEKIFEFSPDFRNEGIDKTHNPEFTQMETMWAYADYRDNMKLCEEMIKFIVKKVHGKLKIKVGNTILNFNKWEKLSFSQALKKYAKIDFDKVKILKDAKKIAEKFNIDTSKIFSKDRIMGDIFEEVVEPKLIQPTFIYDFPKEEIVLAKEKRDNPIFVEAFEPYVKGVELGLSYSEQNNPEILKKHWQMAEELFKKGDIEAQRMDKGFLRALEHGMPPTSGLGIGIDRLTMLLSDKDSIRDVILFPFMKPEETKNKGKDK